jgi:hypothetical protein
MKAAGWVATLQLKGEGRASVQKKLYYENNVCHHYYAILLEHESKAKLYEGGENFHHTMLHGYYKAMLAAMINFEDMQNIPRNMIGKAYGQLEKFFEGAAVGDPRGQQDMLKKRPKTMPKKKRSISPPDLEDPIAPVPGPRIFLPSSPVILIAESSESGSDLDPARPDPKPDAAPAPIQIQNRPDKKRSHISPTDVDVSDVLAIPPITNNAGHKHIIAHMLPELKRVMLDDRHCRLPSRAQVDIVAQSLSNRMQHFWGKNQIYAQRKTVISIVVSHYYDSVRALL